VTRPPLPLAVTRNDAQERRAANRAIALSATGLGATGLVELLLALFTNSAGLLGDAIHNLSDVSTSAVVFLGFRLSRHPPTERYPYSLDRAGMPKEYECPAVHDLVFAGSRQR
jgi:divalent metal cation (Fe/Co/Zn/Cd) transporter